MMPSVQIIVGDCLESLRAMSDESVQCCVTSPPYWGLRAYLKNGDPNKEKEIGCEPTPAKYIARIVELFSEVNRVLKNDGTLWLNLGDSYATGAGSGRMMGGQSFGKQNKVIDKGAYPECQPNRMRQDGFKPKDLVMIPARVAMALQESGWYLRSQIPWVKRQAMPESVEDRPNSAVEYVFLLTKSERYYYNCEAVKVLAQSGPSDIRKMLEQKDRIGGKHLVDDAGELAAANHRTNIGKKRGVGGAVANGRGGKNAFRGQGHFRDSAGGPANRDDRDDRDMTEVGASMVRNWRNSDSFFESIAGLLGDEDGDPLAFVVNPQPFRGAHFATFPKRLVQPMILAGTKTGDVVIDPFGGSGTTGMVALELGRSAILCELNPAYAEMARVRCNVTPGLPL